MKFDMMGIVFMIVAIALAQFLSGYLTPYLGSLAGGLTGVFITGLLAYVVYTFVTKGKFGLVSALLFSVLIYISNMAAGYVDSMIGLGGGLITLVVTGFIASLLWGWIGGRGTKKGKGLKL